MKADFSLATLGKDPHLMFYFVMVANRSFKTSYLKVVLYEFSSDFKVCMRDTNG
jgi:hypothetical protein